MSSHGLADAMTKRTIKCVSVVAWSTGTIGTQCSAESGSNLAPAALSGSLQRDVRNGFLGLGACTCRFR